MYIVPESQLKLFVGDPAYMSCRVTGSPTPIIQWRRKDGQRLPLTWEEDSINKGDAL